MYMLILIKKYKSEEPSEVIFALQKLHGTEKKNIMTQQDKDLKTL